MFIIDTHCHLDRLFLKKFFKNISEYISFCKKKNINYILTVSVNIENFIKNFYMFNNLPNIGISCGIHPLYCFNNNNIYLLKKFCLYKKVIALGETGLDFKSNIDISLKKRQIENFIYHLKIANKLKKPIIIHSRNSFYETLNILKKFNVNFFGGLIHCFSYTEKEFLSNFLDLGLYISISGLVTFKNNFLLRNIIKYIPIDRLLIETDSPYLSPEPYRGLINNPSNIIYIIKKISKIKKINIKNIINIYTYNFCCLFNLNIF